jgi:hypothetical protein
MRLCGSCHSPSSEGLYKTKDKNAKEIMPHEIELHVIGLVGYRYDISISSYNLMGRLKNRYGCKHCHQLSSL